MKFTTTLTLTALILTSTLGVFQKVNAQDTQKNNDAREQIDNVTQPQACIPMTSICW